MPVRCQSYRFEGPKPCAEGRSNIDDFSKSENFENLPSLRPSACSKFSKISSGAALPRNFIRQMIRRAYRFEDPKPCAEGHSKIDDFSKSENFENLPRRGPLRARNFQK